jgi:hypothetical protein
MGARNRFLIPALIFAASLALYVLTLAPSVEWGDFGGYETRITIGELELAPQGHPLWNLISRPFAWLPFGDAAFRVNLSSAFFAALALVVLYAGLMRLTHSTSASLIAVAALALSHTFWTYAVVPKAYSLTLLILGLCIYWLHEWREHLSLWRVAAVGALMGLGVMNHLIVITALPGMLIFLLWHSRRRLMDIVIFGVSFAIGLAPYLYLLSTAPAKSATTGGFITANLEKFMELLTSPQQLLVGVLLTAANLGYQFLLLTFVGLWGAWLLSKRDRSFALMLLLIYLGDVAFVLIPTDPPVMMHWHLYHPAYLAFAYPLAFGARDLLRRWGDAPARRLAWAAAIGVPVLLIYFFLAPGVARAMNLTERLGVRDFPGRDTVTFLFTPSKAGDFGPRHYGEAALDSLPQDAVLFADWTPYAVLWYLQAVEGRRRDVRLLELPSSETLLSAIDRESAAGHLFYLADNNRYYNQDELATRYDIEAAGPVYRVVKRP